MPNLSKLLIIIISLGLFLSPGLLAQELPPETILQTETTPVIDLPSPEVSEAIDFDENIQPQDLDVGEPRILPGNPFYFLKNWARGIRSFFAFNPVTKAELKLKFANEKLIEAKKLAEKNLKVLPKSLENYKIETDRLKKVAERIRETVDDPRVDRFMNKFVDNTLKHQKLFGKFEKEMPPEVYEKIKKVKEESLAKFSDIGLKFAPPEVLKEKIVKTVEWAAGSDFKHFKNLEVLQGIEEMVPEPAKPAIRLAMENSLKRLREKMEAMEAKEREKFQEYIRYIGGNEARHLGILDEIEREELPEAVREEMERAKERILERTENRLKIYEERGLKGAKKEFLGHLTKFGRLKNLRIVKELENNLPPEVISHILPVKEQVEKKFREAIEKADTLKEQKEFFKKIEAKFHDARQLEVFKEIEDIIPPEKKEFFEKIKEKAIEKLKEEVKRAKKMEPKERAMILDKLSGNSPEHIEVLKGIGAPIEVMQRTAERISKRTGIIEEPSKLEILKRKIEEKEGIRNFFRQNTPKIFQKFQAKEEVFSKEMTKERAAQQIEKAKASISRTQKLFETLEFQEKILKNSSFGVLIREAKEHLERAEKALTEENYGQAFGQATAALHNASNAQRIIEKFKRRLFFEEERIKKFETMLKEVKEEIPEITIEAPQELVPELEKARECLISKPPKCEGKLVVEKTGAGCPIFKCVGEITCAKEGERVNRNPLMGPTQQQCCSGLNEIRISKSYSICKREKPEEMECQTDLDCPQPKCPGVWAKCVEGKCVVPRCSQVAPSSGVKPPPEPRPLPEKPIERKEKEPAAFCPSTWEPVCGVNGKTYANECTAKAVGVEIDYKGKCREKPIECEISITCVEGQTPYDTGQKDAQGCPIKKCVPIEKQTQRETYKKEEQAPEEKSVGKTQIEIIEKTEPEKE